jgi:hypothetical protein
MTAFIVVCEKYFQEFEISPQQKQPYDLQSAISIPSCRVQVTWIVTVNAELWLDVAIWIVEGHHPSDATRKRLCFLSSLYVFHSYVSYKSRQFSSISISYIYGTMANYQIIQDLAATPDIVCSISSP